GLGGVRAEVERARALERAGEGTERGALGGDDPHVLRELLHGGRSSEERARRKAAGASPASLRADAPRRRRRRDRDLGAPAARRRLRAERTGPAGPGEPVRYRRGARRRQAGGRARDDE